MTCTIHTHQADLENGPSAQDVIDAWQADDELAALELDEFVYHFTPGHPLHNTDFPCGICVEECEVRTHGIESDTLYIMNLNRQAAAECTCAKEAK